MRECVSELWVGKFYWCYNVQFWPEKSLPKRVMQKRCGGGVAGNSIYVETNRSFDSFVCDVMTVFVDGPWHWNRESPNRAANWKKHFRQIESKENFNSNYFSFITLASEFLKFSLLVLFFLLSLLEQFFLFEVFVKLFHLSSRPSKQNKKARMSQFLFLASSVSISCRKFFEEKVGKNVSHFGWLCLVWSCSSLVLPEKVTTFALVLELAAH